MTNDIFTIDDLKQSEEYGALSPAYFAGRRIAERFTAQFQDEHFKPLVDEFAKQFRDKLWTDVAEWLLLDTESNLHQEMARMVDGTVNAILTGEKWAFNRYALAAAYGDGVKIREAIVKHVPAELQDARIADLIAENEKLREEVRWFREHR